MPNKPRPDNPSRAVRVEDALWDEASGYARENGDSLSTIMRDGPGLAPYVRRERRKRHKGTDAAPEANG